MQKKVLALHDLSGFGRSSLVPIIGVLSAMGHQCVPVPTAIFSTHTAIPGYTVRDLTDDLLPWIEQYEGLGLDFEAVYSGFLGTERQIGCISQAILRLRAPGGIVMVDPVMGDNGEVYETYTPEMCARMGDLCRLADVITPNVTEAAILLGKDVRDEPDGPAETARWARGLERAYGAKVVLTGLSGGGATVGVLCCEEGRTAFFEHARIREYYPGTGDIFSSVLLGGLLWGDGLADAAARAAYFVRDCIDYTASQGTDNMHGVQFETQLMKLARGAEA
ncbi:pyridoxamine kinase [Intestinibacillus massiliensis]|nr:pyridoxamine kinase [Intestinibacillus massiliensis]